MGFSRQEYWSEMPLLSLDILFDHLQFALIHGPNIPGSYAVLLFTASDFTSITSHIHNWVLWPNLWVPTILAQHGPAHQNKTLFPPQSVSPVRKLP